jgi:hypothetical protein
MTFVEAVPKALAALGRQGRPSNGVKAAAAVLRRLSETRTSARRSGSLMPNDRDGGGYPRIGAIRTKEGRQTTGPGSPFATFPEKRFPTLRISNYPPRWTEIYCGHGRYDGRPD